MRCSKLVLQRKEVEPVELMNSTNISSPRQAAYVEWVDIFKGILIIFMVLGHSSSPMTGWIYMFHMPAFMFISGYTANPERNKAIVPFIWKRFKRLIIPYVFWNLVFIAFYRFLSAKAVILLFETPFTISFTDFLKTGCTADIGGATWFLMVLFEISVLYQLLYCALRLVKKEHWVAYAGMMIGVIGFFISDQGYYLPCSFDLALYGTLYYAMGQFFVKKEVLEKHIPQKEMLLLCVAASYIFGFLYPEGMMNWPTRSYVGLTENMVSTICGVYICYLMARWLERGSKIREILLFCGNNTLIILLFHFAAFRVVFLGFCFLDIEPVTYLQNLTPQGDWALQWLVVTTFSLGLCAVTAIIWQKLKETIRLFSKI